VLMCDRLIVLSSIPARISAEIPVLLPHPRNRLDDEFGDIVENIYSILTARTVATLDILKRTHEGLSQPLPLASVNRMSGLIEILAAPPYNGQADLDALASSLSLTLNHLFSIAEGLHVLEFAELKDGAIKLTAAGQVFARGDVQSRKRLFKEHMLQFVPLSAHVCRVLNEREQRQAPRVRFEVELEDHLTRRDAEKTMHALIAWGRYAELFTYEDKTRTFSTSANTAQ
jgi:NitT/TauT family transport system ATP-binding protein